MPKIKLLAPALCALALAAPAEAAAALFQPAGSFGSATAADGRFASAAGIATDDAGRVYVADAGAGHVEVYDNATDGNVFLRSFGSEVLDCPAGIRIDNRGRIYVADACRDVVVFFDSFIDGNTARRQFGGPGTEVGRMARPRGLAVDDAGRVYVAERDNSRLQSWRPSEGKQVPIAAFGVGHPPTFLAPEGVERDLDGRLYVSDDSAGDGEVRVFDRRGLFATTVAGPGSGPGQVVSPKGLFRDPFGRLIVVDSGNRRLQVFAPLPPVPRPRPPEPEPDPEETGATGSQAPGSGFIDAFGGPGSFIDPVDAALAPGALLYVADAGTGQVLRLRYDDADADGVLDGRDTCPGRDNREQHDTDRDGLGDDCDEDDDGDGVGDGSDRCPHTRRGSDGNGDGCGDPTSRISAPRENKRFKRSRPPTRLSGSARADELGVASVEVALARVRGSRCSWYSNGRFGRSGSCSSPVWLRAAGTERWSARVRIRARGRYRVMSRATQEGGVVETRSNRRNRRSFTVG